MKLTRSVMLRFSDDEYDAVVRAKPPGEDLASFARKALVSAVSAGDPGRALRLAASFIVASLSPDITFEEAIGLYDEHAAPAREEVTDGRGD